MIEGAEAPVANNGGQRDCDKSDRRRSSGQERETFYAEQATRGPRVCEFLTTPRGRIFSLLAFYSHF